MRTKQYGTPTSYSEMLGPASPQAFHTPRSSRIALVFLVVAAVIGVVLLVAPVDVPVGLVAHGPAQSLQTKPLAGSTGAWGPMPSFHERQALQRPLAAHLPQATALAYTEARTPLDGTILATMSSLSNEIPSSSRAPVAVVAVGLVMAAGVAMFTVTGTKARQSGIAVVDVEDQALSDDQRSRRSSVGSDGTLSQEIEDIPFTMNDLMKAIPEECFEKSLAWSTFYCLRDFAIVALLYHFQPNFFEFGLAGKFVWWNVVGFYGWCLFVVGHDCGHGTFSKYAWVNEIVGHITHAPLLVPYNGWRITHRHHHQYHNDIDRDHSWRPFGAEALDALPAPLKFMRFSLFVLLLWPVYLLAPRHDYGFSGCHFWPWNPLFKPEERAGVAVSALAVVGMMGLLSACATEYGLGTVMELYGVPYLIFAAWLNLVTLMQHTDPKVSYFRGETWSYLRGALSTVDRTYKQIIDPFNLGYGKIIDHLHHNISDGHVVHHIFFTQIPHYNLKKATEAIKPLLGKYYMFDDTPILNAFAKTMEGCWFVEEEGGAVMYKGKTEYKEWEKDSKSAPSLPQI